MDSKTAQGGDASGDDEIRSNCTVYVVDDLATNRLQLTELLKRDGWSTEEFESAQAFLDGVDVTSPACIVLDVRMPGMSGLKLQDVMNERGITMPVLIMTAHADVPMAIQAMQSGAFDFIERPAKNAVILERVGLAAVEAVSRHRHMLELAELRERFNELSKREAEVLEEMIKGEPNKRIAYTLSISERTVEVHRANVMRKLQVRSLAELVRNAMHVKRFEDPA